jgi:hypothetical protein
LNRIDPQNYARANKATAPAITYAAGLLVAAGLEVSCSGAEVVAEVGGAVTVDLVTTGMVVNTVPEERVAVCSEGIVITSVTGISVPRVMGT